MDRIPEPRRRAPGQDIYRIYLRDSFGDLQDIARYCAEILIDDGLSLSGLALSAVVLPAR